MLLPPPDQCRVYHSSEEEEVAVRIADINRLKNCCPRGHKFVYENLRTGGPGRQCRACHTARAWRYKRSKSGQRPTEEETYRRADELYARYIAQ